MQQKKLVIHVIFCVTLTLILIQLYAFSNDSRFAGTGTFSAVGDSKILNTSHAIRRLMALHTQVRLSKFLLPSAVNGTFTEDQRQQKTSSDPQKGHFFHKKDETTKRILFWGTFYSSSILESYCIPDNGAMDFCPYKCEYSVDQSVTSLGKSDAIIIHGREDPNMKLPACRLPSQRWVFLMFESPDNSFTNMKQWNDIFNWTMSYRTDSDVHIPYGKLVHRSAKLIAENSEDFSFLPTSLEIKQRKLAAWAASNCNYVTSNRKALVDELSNYIPIDLYGACGQNICVKDSREQCNEPQKCHEFLGSRYKFYLAFENSLCRDYITEKFFNSLKYGIVPVVHGPSRATYEKLAPPRSFIHVADFPTVEMLAKYLLYLDANKEEYLKYFEWRREYKVDQVYYFRRAWCNVCEKLHTASYSKDGNVSSINTYASVNNWWHKTYSKDRICKRFKIYKNGTFGYS